MHITAAENKRANRGHPDDRAIIPMTAKPESALQEKPESEVHGEEAGSEADGESVDASSDRPASLESVNARSFPWEPPFVFSVTSLCPYGMAFRRNCGLST